MPETKTPTTKCPICEQDVDENRIVAHITGDADPKCKTPQKYWICEVSGGVLFKDRETNKFWLGGQPNRVIVPVFRDKKEAQKFARNAKHTRPDLINWTRVSEVMII